MRTLLLIGITLISIPGLNAQTTFGKVIESTNPALPSSYNFKEYVFAEPEAEGRCNGSSNETATIQEIFIAQTHRNPIEHPFFFLVGHRPALLQIALTGEGRAPDVQVEGYFEGSSLGTICLAGPGILSAEIDIDQANFEDYFSVTLPKSWIQDGLQLVIKAGGDGRTLVPSDLKIGPYTEMNLVMVNMDIMNYNLTEHNNPIFERFLGELASAIPASVVRFGTFPVTLKFPELVASDNTEQMVKLKSREELFEKEISEGNINSVAMNFLSELHKATGDFLSTVYFGNTLNLAAGGWGGGKSFVSYDYTDIFIHELGHALSLPHWEETLDIEELTEDNFYYPYSGEDGFAGGRGPVWNFIQDTYEFENPYCINQEVDNTGLERSDAMQREVFCPENRESGTWKWDGFGNFSALAMHRNLIGANAQAGEVEYRGTQSSYQLAFQDGYPNMILDNGKRVYIKEENQLLNPYHQNLVKLPGEEKIEEEVYLVYGTVHKSQQQANIVYEPLKYKGTLLPIINPTDPIMFNQLKAISAEEYPEFYGRPRDITAKVTYEDGEVVHALLPFASPSRDTSDDFGIWRYDVLNFSVVVPADQRICKVEAFDREFLVSDFDDGTSGNINFRENGIEATNFMDSARLLASWGVEDKDIEDREAETLVISPNPFNSSLTIAQRGCSHSHLSLFNVMGQKVFEQNLDCSSETVPVSPLSQGVYIAVVKDSVGRVVKRQKMIRN